MEKDLLKAEENLLKKLRICWRDDFPREVRKVYYDKKRIKIFMV